MTWVSDLVTGFTPNNVDIHPLLIFFLGWQMQFSLDEFMDNMAIPYIFELETEEQGQMRKQKNMERYRQFQKEQHRQQQLGMNDQTDILNRFNDLDQTLQTTLG